MKNNKLQLIIINYLFIILFFPFLLASQNIPNMDNLELALKLADGNRIELEKVLGHYGKYPADSLKLKAAKFLIENMDVYSFYASPEIDEYYNRLNAVFSLNERYEGITKEQENQLNQLRETAPGNFRIIPDLQYVTAEFLIDNIDRAFEAWKLPYAKELDFDDFCEYLLPYKSGEKERPDCWRSTYKDTFYSYTKSGLDVSCKLDSGLILHHPSIVLGGEDYFFLSENFDTIPEFTVSCWVNPSEHRNWTRVFDFGKDPANYVCFVPYNPDGVALFQLVSAPGVWEDIKLSTSLPLNQFTHVAMSYSNHFISFYINGILKKRMRTFLTHKDMIRNCIGRAGKSGQSHPAPGSGYFFKGELENFRMYNRELNYAEIHSLAGKKNLPQQKQRLQSIVQGISRLYNINIVYKPLLGGYRSVQLINLKQGSCGDYAVWGTAVFRSLGIPAAIDFVPQWANRSMGHSWNALYTGNGRMEDYSFGAITLLDTIGYHLKENEENETNRASKIFRKTYGKQPETPAVQQKDKYLPPLFRDPCIKDVTDTYLDCMDVIVSLTQQPAKKREYAYLCNFNNQDWIPVHWGKIEEGKAVFTKMGKEVVYLPVYYHWNGIQPAAEPFILTKEGEIKKLIPDHSKKQTLILTRKYRQGKVHQKGELLLGGRFQVANKADFSDSLTVFVVYDVPEIRYNPVNVSLNKPYRYFRFLAPEDSRGDISEIEIYQRESGLKLSGIVIGNKNCPEGWEVENVFDGDPLTSYQCVWGERGWVGLDFGKPVNIASFRFLPRNDDNFIKEGEEYELFYWGNNQWNSLGKQIGTSKQYLEYANAPSNALFWLRNLTKGKEERIFTYENGGQIWW